MARGGKNAKTNSEHKAHGTYRRHRHGDRLEVSTVSEIPPAPADFDKAKSEKWTQVCRDLVEWGMMATADLDALRLYVDSIFIARKALQTLEKEGYYLSLGEGKSKRLHPAFRVYMEATKQERALYDQFGRTPLARTRLKVSKEDKPEVDKIAEIMAGNFVNVEKDKRAKA